MKAAVYTRYRSPDELQLQDVEKPTPKENEVLIKVCAACINSWDWDLLVGSNFLVRLLGGMFKPKNKILGCDVAGIVESVGSKVTQFQSGDEVFGDLSGDRFGCFAEYVCGREKHLAKKPLNLSFEEACTIPQAGLLALQGLRLGGLKSGMSVLINGAGGGVGMFAIQLAKSYSAEITAVDRNEKFEMMRSLGAHHTIDYRKENFTKNGKQYDLILDNIATHSLFACRRSLATGGNYVMTGGKTSIIFQMVFLGKLLSQGSKRIRLVGLQYSPKDLAYMADRVTSGKLKPIIDKSFPLSQTAEAFRHFGKGEYNGKVVIMV